MILRMKRLHVGGCADEYELCNFVSHVEGLYIPTARDVCARDECCFQAWMRTAVAVGRLLAVAAVL